MNLAVFVDEQCAQHEGCFAGRAYRPGQGLVQRRKHFDEASIASRQLAEIPAHRHELLVRSMRDDRALNHDDLTSGFELRDPRPHRVFAMRRMRKDAARQLAEAEPGQLFAQVVAGRARRARENDQRPFAIPFGRRRAVDSPGCLGKARASVRREAVEADAAAALRSDPLLVRESADRRAHVPIGDAERTRELDQTPQRNDTAARRDRITEDRHQQRAAAQRTLTAKACDKGFGAARELVVK